MKKKRNSDKNRNGNYSISTINIQIHSDFNPIYTDKIFKLLYNSASGKFIHILPYQKRRDTHIDVTPILYTFIEIS